MAILVLRYKPWNPPHQSCFSIDMAFHETLVYIGHLFNSCMIPCILLHSNVFLLTACNKKKLKWIIDATIGYENDQPLSLLTVVNGSRPAAQTSIHYRIYRADLIPQDTDSMTEWLYARYTEKDQMLAEFKRTGKFPIVPTELNGNVTIKEPKLIKFDCLWFIAIHMFYLISAFFQWKMICAVCSLMMSFLGLFM